MGHTDDDDCSGAENEPSTSKFVKRPGKGGVALSLNGYRLIVFRSPRQQKRVSSVLYYIKL